ncbi:hypothetical protein ACX40Y_06490 [Sphingomonas sp. RS6]
MTNTFPPSTPFAGAASPGRPRPLRRQPFGTRRKAVSSLVAALLLAAATLFLFWPGIASYDSVVQYQQLLSGRYDDWHPPAMARLWSLFHAAGWHGQAPMFALQILLYWGGIGLFSAALIRCGRPVLGIAALLLGLWPPLLGWQVVVLKDAQMAGTLAAAVGLASLWRLSDRAPPGWAKALVLLLLGYATLVRFNAAFASVPLAFGLVGGIRWDRSWRHGALLLAATAATLTLLGPINHRLLDAEPSGVERSLPLFDLAGIVHHAGPAAVPQVPPRLWHRAEAKGCLTPILWDPLGADSPCGYIDDALARRAPGSELEKMWVGAIAAHPLAHAQHRIAHWNSEMRLWAPAAMPGTGPLAGSEPNSLGLASPQRRIEGFQLAGAQLAASVLGAPILWFVAALGLLVCLWPARDARSGMAITLALSALFTESAFAVIGVASDYRYHCWSMLATGLALLAGWRTALPPLRHRLAAAAILVTASVVLVARLTLPAAAPPL